jgi:kynurenine formamidase
MSDNNNEIARERRRWEEAVLNPARSKVPERREEFDGGRIVDISHYYRADMPAWVSAEGSGEFLRLARSMRNGSDIANFSELRLTAHSGTHVDAPGHVFEHYYDAGFDVDTLDLAVLNGPALLVDVPRDKNITGKPHRQNILNQHIHTIRFLVLLL